MFSRSQVNSNQNTLFSPEMLHWIRPPLSISLMQLPGNVHGKSHLAALLLVGFLEEFAFL